MWYNLNHSKAMTTFNMQPESSTVNWTGKKVSGLHTGTINLQSGYLSFDHKDLSAGEIVMDMTSIRISDITDASLYNAFFDHLNHDDFFSVNQFKTAKLVIIKGEELKGKYHITADLTIKDISHPVNFVASIGVFTDSLHATGDMVIDRTLYDIRYGSGKFLHNPGDKLIYDEFMLQFKLVGQN